MLGLLLCSHMSGVERVLVSRVYLHRAFEQQRTCWLERCVYETQINTTYSLRQESVVMILSVQKPILMASLLFYKCARYRLSLLFRAAS